MKKLFKIILLSLIVLMVGALSYVLITFPPIMTGMAAKTMCSCIYVMGRTPESVVDKELQVFPGMPSLPYEISQQDSSVSFTMLWKTTKAIYRKGLGCTLLAERSEEEVRNQQISVLPTPVVNQDSIPWPSGNKVSDSLLSSVDYAAVNKLIDDGFLEPDPSKPLFTHAIVIVYDGQIIGEKYAPGFDHNTRMMGWSMGKSMTSALIGVLTGEGKLRIDDPAPIAEWQQDKRKEITINNLLQASSGLDWSESYFVPTSDFHNMFIKSDDKAGYAASRPLKHDINTFFQYSSGTTNILSRILRQTVGDNDYYKFPYEKLFYKIGMYHALLEPDAAGTFVGSSYAYASARDWARFGLLYLNDGVWNGERALPEGWVKYSTTPGPAAPLQQYGAQIWLNRGETKDPRHGYPGLPDDTFVFDGFEENYVVVIPSKKLVVVRLGVTHGQSFDIIKLIQGVGQALPQ